MWLQLAHPEVANRDCSTCRKWFFKPDGTKTKHLRKDVLCKPACETDEGCPKGHWSKPQTLSEKNWQAYDHYLGCQAVGSFPADGIVRRNAAIIHQTLENYREYRQQQFEERQLAILRVRHG